MARNATFTMDLILQLEAKVAELKKNGEAFYSKGVKAAGPRTRKAALEIKKLTDAIRKNVTETKEAAK